MNAAMDQLRETIRQAGAVRTEMVRQLRDSLLSAGPIGPDEAEWLFEIQADVRDGDNDPAWQALFVDALTAFLLGDPADANVLGDDKANYVISKLGEGPNVGSVALELLVNVCAHAERVPDRFLDYAISALRHATREDGRIAESRVGQIRRIIYGSGVVPRHAVDRRMADFLFDLNDAMAGRPNHPTWTPLFVEAISDHVLADEQSPGEVDASEADWLVQRMEADQQYDDAEKALLAEVKHFISYDQVWGGIHSDDLQASTNGVVASLYCRACEGGKGGDLYYFSVSANDMLTRIALADVSGHGPAVSDVSQWIYDSLAARISGAEGSEVLADLNRLASEQGYRALTTAVVVTFFRPDSRLSFTYAGHPPMFVHRKSEGQWRVARLDAAPHAANLPLGVDSDMTYDEQRIPLAEGDRLFLYTDGVVEAPNHRGQIFGPKRLLAALAARSTGTPKQVKDGVLGAIQEHTGGRLAHDDVTFMVVEIR
jgi:sigma-B regulation protein RsbU (phosphoserine phosphatase)